MSEPKIEAFGVVKNGQLQIKGRKQFDFQLNQFESKEVEIVVKRKRIRRSGQQNNYIHAVLIPEFKAALNEVGFDEIRTNEQCKELMKGLFLQHEIVNEKSGEVLKTYKNTSELTTTEMMNFIDGAVKYALENMNYRIALPNKQTEIF